MSNSLSKTPIKIRAYGLGYLKGEIIRFLAPLTVEKLLRKLPLEGRANPLKGGFSLIVGIKKGEEKSVREVTEGIIAYWPQGDALCIFHSNTSTYSPVNKVGRISKNLELIEKITSSTRIRIERVQK